MSENKWFEELEQRYLSLRPNVKNSDEFDLLNNVEKCFFADFQRVIDEVKAVQARMADFQWVLSKLPGHELIVKVNSGKIKPEDKEPYNQ